MRSRELAGAEFHTLPRNLDDVTLRRSPARSPRKSDFACEHTRAGLAIARERGTKSGKPLGRPKLDAKRERAVRDALAAGLGINRVARMVGTGNTTVAAIAEEMRNCAGASRATPAQAARGGWSTHSPSS